MNAEPTKQEFGFELPTETLPLPSRGIVYHRESALYMKETVDIKAMTTREEDILTNKSLLKKGTVVTELIKSCLTDKSIDPRDLLVGDRNALTVAIRITGYGAEYPAEIECPACSTKSKFEFDLSALPLRRLELDPLEEGRNIFEFVLPYTKKAVRFKFLTGRDEEELVSITEKQKKMGVFSETNISTSLFHSVVSIEGISERAKISQFVKSMPARDSLALRNFIKDNEPGIIMDQEFSCNACGHLEEVNVPLGVTFLWPSAGR